MTIIKYSIQVGLLLILILGCNSKKENKKNNNSSQPYSKNIDDIIFDPKRDNSDFKLCGNYTYQYFNDSKGLIYKGHKPEILKAFAQKYDTTKVPKETGLVRVRFVVNCKGEADRFRLLGMDRDYSEKVFDPGITEQLLSITKGLKGWGIKKIDNQPIDYYQYLIFAIDNGKITKILP